MAAPSRRTVLVGSAAAVLILAVALVVSFLGPGGSRSSGDGTGRPVLLITSTADPYSRYYAEILRAEGFSSFQSAELTELTDAALNDASVALLPALPLTADQAGLINGWVERGGNLVAIRPDAQIAGATGLTKVPGVLRDGYLTVDASRSPGLGITAESMQFHGDSDLYTMDKDTRQVAALSTDAKSRSDHPAVTLREVPGASGRVAAFSYDLARSILLTRQGNPAWAGQERDGVAPIRPNELFEGTDGKDFVDMAKVAIPQADEQQRLLGNVLMELTGSQNLQIRSWYFPKGAKAVLILAADDHSPGDRARESLAYQESQSPPSCSVADWECIRSTSLMYTNGNLTDTEFAGYHEKGFDFGVHVNTGCKDWTKESLTTAYTDDLAGFKETYPSQPAQVANRIHCVAWSDYVSAAKIGRDFGLRLDLDYYYWPAAWVRNRPGFFTGSGIPMRFADQDGTTIDAYQAPTHLVNESGMTYPAAIETLLDRALGPLGYYGAFGTHYDYSDRFDRQLIAVGKEKGVPMVSAAQMLSWLDARAAANFTPVTWNGATASFTASVPAEARELMRGMVPLHTSRGVLTALTKDGQDIPFTTETIKGERYGLFTATTGEYRATYAADTNPPALESTTPANGQAFSTTTGITAMFNEPIACGTASETSIRLIAPSGETVPTRVSCDPDGIAIQITPTGKLTAGARYRLVFDETVTDLAGNPLQPTPELSFPAGGVSVSLWNQQSPDGVAVATDDHASVELGVRFSATAKGRVTGIWFYRPADDLPRHTVTLWTSSGTALASARTSKESATAWQYAKLNKPVRLTPGKTYVASFRAPRGQYSYVPDGLKNAIIEKLLTTPDTGGSYRYGKGVPDKASAINYLVDIAFVAD